MNNDNWLNQNINGDQRIIKEHTEEIKKKMSANNAAKRPEIQEKIRLRQTGSSNSFFGRHHSEEAKKTKSEKIKGGIGEPMDTLM